VKELLPLVARLGKELDGEMRPAIQTFTRAKTDSKVDDRV
jgi:hypothetical protein